MKRVIYILGVLLMLSACSEDGNSKSNLELLTQKSWFVEDISLEDFQMGENIEKGVISIELAVKQCLYDNVISLKSNGEYVFNPGKMHCEDRIEESDVGIWRFVEDENYIEFNFESDSAFSYKIIVLTEKRLVVEIEQDVNKFMDTNTSIEANGRFRIEFIH